MYTIIVGGGDVGHYLARILLGEGHEILVIEKDSRQIDLVSEELGDVVMRGDGCEARVLEEAGTARAAMLIAVTGHDEDNLVACQVAKHKFNVPQTIARIKNPTHKALFEKLGIDATVCSTELILARIGFELPSHPIVPLIKLRGQGLEVVEVKIPAKSKMVGTDIASIQLPERSRIALIIRKDKGPLIPFPDIVIAAEDEIVAVAEPGSQEKLRDALAGK
ncbi:MAG: NAD-binding protein [Dehalococcoidia bacterium]|nr:NAD-binding protein [Dehalococcoidia bacterium]